MLANYQIKRSESNNFGNLNNDYSRFSDNNVINLNLKNLQQMQNYEYNSNHRNNSFINYNNNINNSNNFEQQQNEYASENNFESDNNQKIIYQQHLCNEQNSRNFNNFNNNKNFNLRINTNNSTNRSSDFAYDKSVLFSPHFNQVNNQNIISGLKQFQHNPVYNSDSCKNINANEFNNVKSSERDTPNRKGTFY